LIFGVLTFTSHPSCHGLHYCLRPRMHPNLTFGKQCLIHKRTSNRGLECCGRHTTETRDDVHLDRVRFPTLELHMTQGYSFAVLVFSYVDSFPAWILFRGPIFVGLITSLALLTARSMLELLGRLSVQNPPAGWTTNEPFKALGRCVQDTLPPHIYLADAPPAARSFKSDVVYGTPPESIKRLCTKSLAVRGSIPRVRICVSNMSLRPKVFFFSFHTRYQPVSSPRCHLRSFGHYPCVQASTELLMCNTVDQAIFVTQSGTVLQV
jgi:hypothetical protein